MSLNTGSLVRKGTNTLGMLQVSSTQFLKIQQLIYPSIGKLIFCSLLMNSSHSDRTSLLMVFFARVDIVCIDMQMKMCLLAPGLLVLLWSILMSRISVVEPLGKMNVASSLRKFPNLQCNFLFQLLQGENHYIFSFVLGLYVTVNCLAYFQITLTSQDARPRAVCVRD